MTFEAQCRVQLQAVTVPQIMPLQAKYCSTPQYQQRKHKMKGCNVISCNNFS